MRDNDAADQVSGALDVLPNKTIVEALVTAIDAGDEAAVRTIVDEGLVSRRALGDVHGRTDSSRSCCAMCAGGLREKIGRRSG